MNEPHWTHATQAAQRVGTRIVNGTFERHFGIDDMDVVGMADATSSAFEPVLRDAFAARTGEPWIETLGRRITWGAGVAVVTVLVLGAGWFVWDRFGEDES